MYCWWNFKLVQSLWESGWWSLKKLKTRTTVCPNNLPSGYLFKEIQNTNSKDICIPMFRTELIFTIARYRSNLSDEGLEDIP